MIMNSPHISDRVKKVYNPNECVYKQKPDFYIRLNNQLLKECNWCPFNDADCEVCGGLDEILMHECYDCDECNLWDRQNR